MQNDKTRPANCDKCGRFVGPDAWVSTDPETGWADEVLCGQCRGGPKQEPKPDGLPEQVRYEDLTEKDLDMLRHMLGWQDRSKKHPPDGRDYGCPTPGDQLFQRLESLGLVVCVRKAGEGILHDLDTFYTTDLGKAMARRSFYRRRHGKAKRLYSAWLDIAYCFERWTFGDFLRSEDPDIVAMRRNA